MENTFKALDGVEHTYPAWCQNDVDKAIAEIIVSKESTRTEVKNLVKERIIKRLLNMSLDDRIDYLISTGAIQVGELTKNFKVLKAK